ncbi:inner membrane protein YbhQ [Klebsiella pneumoniae]|nr:inner membrane protein YbhQ [Klebsiella pneumoniae]
MLPKRNWWRLGVSVMAFHFLRHFPHGSAGYRLIPRGWPESARRSSRKLKLRTASSLQPGIIHYEQITSPLADGEKSAYRALFYRRHRLLVIYAQKVDWQDVWKVIRGYDRLALFSAIALVIVSYLIYGCYDLLGRAYCGHKLAKRQVMLVSFICYAFNLTLSTWVGGIGMRYGCTRGWG